jgi:DNA modification methylase
MLQPKTKKTNVTNLSLFPELSPVVLPAKQAARQVSTARLPTNTTTYQHPVHRWFNFIAGFSPEFVQNCCASVREETPLLLDPFAGCATAPLVACQLGFRAIGFEAHPVFARIATAKLTLPSSVDELNHIEHIIQPGIQNPELVRILPLAPAAFLTKLFPLDVLQELLGAREALIKNDLIDNEIAFLLLSKVVDLSSHSQTDGIYKAPTSKKNSISPGEACAGIAQIMREDLIHVRLPGYQNRGRIINSSSESMIQIGNETVSLIVTSPPYLNNFDYAEMTRMYLYFWGMAESWGDITDKVRSKLIVNTTTALRGHKQRQDEYRDNIADCLVPSLDDLVYKLAEQRKIKPGKKEYDFLVFPYFSQMTNVFRECFRSMKAGATIHVLIGDAALYGIHISTPQYFQRILEKIGFRDVSSTFLRPRGHRWILAKRAGSETGLGEYHIQALK